MWTIIGVMDRTKRLQKRWTLEEEDVLNLIKLS